MSAFLGKDVVCDLIPFSNLSLKELEKIINFERFFRLNASPRGKIHEVL